MKPRSSTLLFFLLVACDGESPDPVDAPPDSFVRACSESYTYTDVNRPPCTWEWTCNDFTAASPQYSATCTYEDGGNVACECREAGVVTGNVTLPDGCLSVASACEGANAGCGFRRPISCPQ